MKTKITQKHLWLFVILPAFAVYAGFKFYAQYRPVKILVSRVAPLPAELAAGLHMQEHKINPMVTIESPYESAEIKPLTWAEIRTLRRQIAWNGLASPFYDSITIQSSNNVVVRRETSRSFAEYQLTRQGRRWSASQITTRSVGK